MGRVPATRQQWIETISKHCPKLDSEIVAYLAGIAIDDPSSTETVQALTDALQDYDAAPDLDTAQHLCRAIFDDLGVRPSEDGEERDDDDMRSDEAVQSISELTIGQRVVCRHGSDNMWYSGSVLRCHSDQDVTVWIERFNQEIGVPIKAIRVSQRTGLTLSELASGFASVDDKRISMRERIAKDANKIFESMKDDKKRLIKEEKQRAKSEKGAIYKQKLVTAQTQAARDSETALHLRIIAAQAASKSTGSKDVIVSNMSLPAIGGGSDLLVDAALRFAAGRRYGLCGRNGIGKSTLLKAMVSYEIKSFPMNVRVLYVEQEVRGSDTSVIDWVLHADVEREALLAEEEKLNDDPTGAERLSQVYERLRDIDAWGAEARASTILSGLQFSPEMQQAPTKSLSGGWRMRVALATALFLRPDLLLLDEPTNHLDFPAVLWLESYLCELPSTLVVVSHDRVFINNVVTDVVHQDNRTLTYYKGNYDAFEKTRSDARKQQHKLHEANDKKRRHMQSFIDRFRYNANRARLVQSRIKAMEKLGVVDDVDEDSLFRFDFPDPEPLQKHIIQFDDVVFDYDANSTSPLLVNVNVRLDMESRVGVIGANGCGKTTLVKLMTGQMAPLSGYVWINPSARIEVFTQHHIDQLDLSICALEYFRKLFPQFELQFIRGHLGRFGVGGDLATQTIGTLSGGQKSRVAFAKITILKPHLIIMDEPTNHMDLETVDTLLNALSTFSGGALLISHDQHFLMNAATEYWSLTKSKVQWLESFQAAKSHTYANL